jgi:hypothetical protein
MFNLVQQDPGETVLLSTSKSRERLLFIMGQMKMRNPHCFYEIMTTDEIQLANS